MCSAIVHPNVGKRRTGGTALAAGRFITLEKGQSMRLRNFAVSITAAAVMGAFGPAFAQSSSTTDQSAQTSQSSGSGSTSGSTTSPSGGVNVNPNVGVDANVGISNTDVNAGANVGADVNVGTGDSSVSTGS